MVVKKTARTLKIIFNLPNENFILFMKIMLTERIAKTGSEYNIPITPNQI